MSLKNADVVFGRVEIKDRHLCVAMPQSFNACWVTSLSTAIGPMARQEIDREMTPPSSLAAKALSQVFEALGRLLRIDDVIFPEHHLLTTSLYHPEDLTEILAAGDAFARRYPDKAVVIRSLNARDHLAHIGPGCWPIRMIWIIDDIAQDCLPRRDTQRDTALLSQLNLKRQVHGKAITENTLSACVDLYRELYLSTYSKFNPDYETSYLRHLLEESVLELVTLEDSAGQVEAFCALHACGDILSVPLLGYNRRRSQAEGLYRATMLQAVQEAQTRGLRLNLSAGAAAFKRHRGAKPYMEYLLIMDGHLPYWRRWGYAMIGRVLRLMAPALERTAS
ncbi:GNAT family N-acetyltransferase [Asticcacaulis benevestitus]|nr:GNAT family N-acetyltransferase [Asticcacaulis benevestitus]